MKKEILISFIVPMYNAERYIGKCLDSIVLQNLDPESYEVLVVDDGSVDNGKEIVEKYEKTCYVRQENLGVSAARNKGIELSSGRYLCFVDSDDELVPDTIKPILDKANKHDLDVLTFEYIMCTDNRIKNEHPKRTDEIEDILSGKEYMERYDFPHSVWWFIVKRQSLKDQRFVVGRYVEDAMFTIEMFMHVERVAHIKNQCYYYFIRPHSIITNKDKSHLNRMIEDYYYAYHYIQNLIAINADSLPAGAISRCNHRSESFIYFLLIRLLGYPDISTVKSWIFKLKKEGLYPMRQPYEGLKFSVSAFVVNNYYLLCICNRLFRFNQILKRRKE